MCIEANKLRAKWYAATPQISPDMPDQLKQLVFTIQASTEAYVNAREELSAHIKACPVCQKELHYEKVS